MWPFIPKIDRIINPVFIKFSINIGNSRKPYIIKWSNSFLSATIPLVKLIDAQWEGLIEKEDDLNNVIKSVCSYFLFKTIERSKNAPEFLFGSDTDQLTPDISNIFGLSKVQQDDVSNYTRHFGNDVISKYIDTSYSKLNESSKKEFIEIRNNECLMLLKTMTAGRSIELPNSLNYELIKTEISNSIIIFTDLVSNISYKKWL